MRYRHRLLAIVAALAATCPAFAFAQQRDWVDQIFPSRSFDFGTVARGSKVHHSFQLVNTTNSEIHIATYQTKCGCTEVRLGANTVPPGTQTIIEAVIDTTKFQGPKASGLTLIIDKPQYRQVDLNLNCFIRADLTVTPGQADFGQVIRSKGPTVDLSLTYAGGQADWAISKMQTLSPHVTARGREVSRSPGGQVSYAISVTLNPSAPTGYFKDEITLFTNDPSSPTFPISVTGNVQSTVTATPSVLTLGAVKPGEEIKKTLLVRSTQPFKIVGVTSNRAEITAPTPADAAKALHPVVVTLKAPNEPGPFYAVLEVQSDVKDEPPTKISTFATVVGP